MAPIRTLIVLCALALLGCEPQSERKAAREAGQTLDKALTSLDPAARGTRHVEWKPDSPLHEDYRVAQLAAAAAQVAPIANSGSQGQRFTALNLMGEAEAAAARQKLREASEAWSLQNALASQLTSTASAVGLAARIAAEQGKVNYDPQLADLRKQEQEAQGRIDQLTRSVAELNQQIAQLQQQIASTDETRKARANEAADLSRKAFQAEGRLRHDLTVQAAQATRQSDQASAKAEGLAAQLSILQSRLALEQSMLTGSRDMLQQAKEAAAELQQRSQQASQQVEANRGRVTALTQEFDGMLRQLVEQQDKAVLQPMAQSNSGYAQAIKHLEAARGAAPGDASQLAELSLIGTQIEYGMALKKQAAIHESYGRLLETLAASVEANLPERAATIRDAVQAASKASTEAAQEAQTQLTGTLETLQQVSESGQEQVQRAALGQLVQVNSALGAMTGDAKYQQAAQAAQQRLDQMTAPPPTQ